MDARREYIARLNRVLYHIDRHLADPLDLAALANVAHFSAWHFHRLFSSFVGETLADYVRRRRLEVAANRLWANRSRSVLSIALETGFASAQIFSRNFRQHFAQSPTQWRNGGHRDWATQRRAQLSKIHQLQRKNRQDEVAALAEHDSLNTNPEDSVMHTPLPVTLQTLPDTNVAYMRRTGPYGPAIAGLWQRFMGWCGSQGLLSPRRAALYGISLDNPEVTAPEHCRYDACIAVDAGFKPGGDIGVQKIPGGRYACAEFKGSSLEVGATWAWLCGEWIAGSGFQFDDRPIFELYPQDWEQDGAAGRFHCLLCIPVRPL